MRNSKDTRPTPKPIPENGEIKNVRLHVNAFGEIVRDVKTDDLNAFLDETVPDKKLSESEDIPPNKP